MNSAQFMIALLHGFDGSTPGRTLLQKRAYFVSLLSGIDPGLDFGAHFYGPFSPIVEGAVTQLKDMGFVQEQTNEFGVTSDGFEMRRYDYRLTAQGNQILPRLEGIPEFDRVVESAKRIKNAGDPDYVELSIAAKAFFILSKQNRPMSVSEITKEATKFNWTIGEQQVKKSVDFLQALGLTGEAEQPSS